MGVRKYKFNGDGIGTPVSGYMPRGYNCGFIKLKFPILLLYFLSFFIFLRIFHETNLHTKYFLQFNKTFYLILQ